MPYVIVAGEPEMTLGMVKVAAHQLHRRYETSRAWGIGRTMDDPAGSDDQIRELSVALACRERRDPL